MTTRSASTEGIDSSLSPYEPLAKLRYHWALRDSMEEAGLRFTNELPRVFHNTVTGRLTTRSRTSQAERLGLWVGSIQVRAPRVLLETKWVEAPAGTVSVDLPDIPLVEAESKALLHKILSRNDTHLLAVPRVVNVAPRRGRLEVVADTEIAPARKIKTGSTLAFLNLVDATLENIHLELEAQLVSIVGHADPKSYNPGGDRRLVFPITREITLRRQVAVPDQHAIIITGTQTNYVNDHSLKVAIPGETPLRRKSIFAKRRKAERKELVLFVTASLINTAGDPLYDRSR